MDRGAIDLPWSIGQFAILKFCASCRQTPLATETHRYGWESVGFWSAVIRRNLQQLRFRQGPSDLAFKRLPLSDGMSLKLQAGGALE